MGKANQLPELLLDNVAEKTPLSKVKHELNRVRGFIEDSIERLENGHNVEKAKYYMGWSQQIVGEVINQLREVEAKFFKEEASHDALQKPKT